MSPILQIQRRMMQLGRVRLGEKAANGAPKKLDTFRFTSASRALLEAVAEQHGGTVTPWENAPSEGYFQVTTEATALDIILPPVFSDVDGSPTLPYSQWYERWSAGGCERRCDGVTESLSGKPCMCDREKRKANAKTECRAVTRVSFMLPDIPGLGVWRLDSLGWNAAVELPLTLEVLSSAAREQRFIPAVLSIQHRTSKRDGQTFRYVVPVIELKDATIKQLASGDVPLAINAPVSRVAERPALPPAPAPSNGAFENGRTPEFGERPALPAASSAAPMPASEEPSAVAPDAGAEPAPKLATAARKKKLDVLVGTLRDGGHINNEQLWRAMGREPILREEDGELHWSDLRELLTNDEASQLIDRLAKLEARVKENDSPFQAPASVTQ